MKKLISTVLAAALTLSLAACGSTAASSTPEAASGSEAASTASSETASDASDAACGSAASTSEAAPAESTASSAAESAAESTAETSELAGTTLKVAASPTPHAEILNVAKEILAEQGIDLQVVEFSDYVQPNLVTESGEVDANYFQHGPYLEDFNEKNNTHLVSVAAIHYEPLGLYPGKTKSLNDLADGAKIAVPNDTTNEARALQLLAAQGIITLKEDAGLAATKNDVVDNPHNIELVEMEAAQLPRTLSDVDFAVINGNYAATAGFSASKDALAVENATSEAAQTYTNLLVVEEGNENEPAIKALVAALTSQTVKDYIDSTYDGAVVAVF